MQSILTPIKDCTCCKDNIHIFHPIILLYKFFAACFDQLCFIYCIVIMKTTRQLVKYGKIHCWFIATSSVDNSFRSLLPNSLFDVICIFTFIYKTYTWTRIVTFSRAMFLHSFNSNKNNKLCISKYKLEKQLLNWGGYDNHSFSLRSKRNQMSS